jgi:hypothetical protein
MNQLDISLGIAIKLVTCSTKGRAIYCLSPSAIDERIRTVRFPSTSNRKNGRGRRGLVSIPRWSHAALWDHLWFMLRGVRQ